MNKNNTRRILKLNKTPEEMQKEAIQTTFEEVKKIVENDELNGFVFGAYTKKGEMILTTTETQSTLDDYAIACFLQNYFANDLTLNQIIPLLNDDNEGDD